jgi:hypothetical protein
MKSMIVVILAVLASLAARPTEKAAEHPVPLTRAHAHNDYEHPRPLLDALDRGFCSVEADIFLVDGKLLVAHDLDKVSSDRTLQGLYLDPLRAFVARENHWLHPRGPSLVLLIDIKSEANSTYAALRPVLEKYADMLTRFHGDRTETNSITIILSGNRPREMLRAESVRYAAYDGRLPDLESNASPHFIPLISENWRTQFSWRGQGSFPEDEKTKLRRLIERTHAQGKKIRFWAAPDHRNGWAELHAAGVDFINTDNLDGLKDFLLSETSK